MAEIEALKNGRGEVTSYRIRVSLGRTKDGKKIRSQTTFEPQAKTEAKIRKEVEAFAAQYEREVKEGHAFSDGDRLRFDELVKIWDKQYLSVRAKTGDMTQRCREDYMNALRIHVEPSIGHLRLNKIKAIHIDAIVCEMMEKGLSPKTIRNTFNATRGVFNYAFRKDMIKENPCARCNPLPKIKRGGELHCFTEEQIHRFLNVALTKDYEVKLGGRVRKSGTESGDNDLPISAKRVELKAVPFMYRVFFTIALYSGFRRGEMVALTWDDIDFDKCTIRINKAVGKSRERGQIEKEPKTEAGMRTITLPQVCFDLLWEWRKKEWEMCFELGSAWKGKRGKDINKNYVFIKANGERMDIDAPTHKFKEVLIRYNESVPEEERLPIIRLHDLRHTNISYLLSNGVDIKTAQRRAGHDDIATTINRYAHAIESEDEKAAAVLDRVFAAR